MKKEKFKVVSSKKWTIELQQLDNDLVRLKRINRGFTAYELLGIISHTKDDILKQMSGEIKPDIIERKLIENGNNNDTGGSGRE